MPPTLAETESDGEEDRVETRNFDISMRMGTRYVAVAILFTVNLLNYMDRYTIAGVLQQVQAFYKIGNTEAGYLQAIFIVGYMLFSPVFGVLGDRFNRKYLMVGGIFFWSCITLASSFVPSESFWLLVLLRGLVGVGEASYSTIAPTIISDMFTQSQRSMALMAFYFAIPVGAGLGYIVGAEVAKAAHHWYWALRVTPGLGVICCLLILFVLKEPPRGMAEHATLTHSTGLRSILTDLNSLVRNKSFMLNTFGFVCVAFVTGALALFAPSFVYDGYKALDLHPGSATISLDFGFVTCGAGVIGILCGGALAYVVKKKHAGGDALVCALGLSSSSIFLFFAIFSLTYTVYVTWIFIFVGMTLVCMNWSLSADILLYTVVPTRRSTAEAFMNFVGHLLGDAGSPYLLGFLSDHLKAEYKLTSFVSMQYSLYTCCVVAMLGGCLYIICSFYIPSDRAKADAIAHGAEEERVSSQLTNNYEGLPEADDAPLL
ncbi:protein spinster homolog 1-like [Watersipora subatra]|uniref:protein spinster homolog 1-like n=1 Tax=Watersipora subatra TaxID=2589382 RepID=UPI00355B999F